MYGVFTILNGLVHPLGERNRPVRILQKHLSFGRRLQFSLPFDKNLDAKFLLEQLDVVAHRRLRQRERFRRLGKGADLVELEQRFDFGVDHVQRLPL